MLNDGLVKDGGVSLDNVVVAVECYVDSVLEEKRLDVCDEIVHGVDVCSCSVTRTACKYGQGVRTRSNSSDKFFIEVFLRRHQTHNK